MKIIVTGFEPFGGEKVNPSLEVVKKIKDNIAGADVVKVKVPVVFDKAIKVVENAIEKEKPDFVLSIGQAGGRNSITVERIAININDARMNDNEGNCPVDVPIDEKGDAAYFATIPVKEIVKAIRNIKILAAVSNSAGTFVCNNLMYGVLNYISKNKLNIKSGFIHVPYLLEQVTDKNAPSMSFDIMVRAAQAAIEAIVSHK